MGQSTDTNTADVQDDADVSIADQALEVAKMTEDNK